MDNQICRVLSIKSFLLLWLAEVFSQIGFNMINFILIILAFELSNSNTAVSGIVLSFTIPAIIFGLLAGVYVDRWNKKKVLFTTNIIRAILLFSLVFFHTNLALVYIISFSTAVVTQFFIPAEVPMIPLLVKKELLFSANALFGMGIYGSIFVAYALSGVFILVFGNVYTFLIITGFFLLAAIFVYFIKISPRADKEESQNQTLKGFRAENALKEEIKAALQLIIRTKEIYSSLFLLTLSQTIVLILAVIGPGFTKQVLNINVEQFPLFVVTPAALGMVIGALMIGNYLNQFSKQKMANFGVLLSGIAIILLPFGSEIASRGFITAINLYLPGFFVINILHIVIFLAFVLGVANALVFVPSNTILQEKATNRQRGKIYGTLNALSGICSLLPIIMVGSLADLLGVSSVLTGIGVILLIIGIIRLMIK